MKLYSPAHQNVSWWTLELMQIPTHFRGSKFCTLPCCYKHLKAPQVLGKARGSTYPSHKCSSLGSPCDETPFLPKGVFSSSWNLSHAFNLTINNSIAFVSLISECCLYSLGCSEAWLVHLDFVPCCFSRVINKPYPVYWSQCEPLEAGSCGDSH